MRCLGAFAHPTIADPVLTAAVHRFAIAALAPSTRRTYSTGQRQYIAFCNLHRVTAVPGSELTLIYFACSLARKVTPGTIKQYLAAVRALHLDAGFPSPTDDCILLPRILRGIKRCLGEPRRPRLAVTTSILSRLCTALLKTTTISYHDRILLRAAMTLAFYGFLRCAEFTSPPVASSFNAALHATRGDVILQPGQLDFQIKVSKTDPFRQGSTVHMAATQTSTCPVAAMTTYLAYAPAPTTAPLFTLQSGRLLTREFLTATLRQLLPAAGVPQADLYAGHSFRIGAATSAAAANVPDWLIQTMGRWSSNCYKQYIHAPRSAVLSVSASLASAAI